MPDKLKPCQKCKRDAAQIRKSFLGLVICKVVCDCCGNETPNCTEEEAVPLWNKRQGENDGES